MSEQPQPPENTQSASGNYIAQADRGSTANVNVINYRNTAPRVEDPAILDQAQQRLEELPLEDVPTPTTLPPGSIVPFSPNPLFVGREEELKALAAALTANVTNALGSVIIVAATGLGGVGKTQLASEFTHRYGQYFLGGVFWLSFADADSIPAEVASCGGAGRMQLRPDFHTLPFADQIREVMSAWQSAMPRLLVFDNCENEELLNRWRPPTGGCHVLVTSRKERWDLTLGAEAFRLNVLNREDSIALLREHRTDVPPDDPNLDAIANDLGDLPLALDLAGRYLAKYRLVVSLAQYLEELRQPDLLDHRSMQEGGISPTDHEQNVARTFALSYERLESDDPTDVVAVALLARAARFAPGEPIPHDLIVSTLTLSDDSHEALLRAEDALGKLTELGLLETVEETAFRMHRLLSLFALNRTGDEGAQAAVETALLEAVHPFINSGSLAPLLAYFPHLRAVSDVAEQREDERVAALFSSLAHCLEFIGSYGESRLYLERALDIRVRVYGEENLHTAQSCQALALILKRQGAYGEARRLYEKALQTRKKLLGDEHPAVASTLSNLGVLSKEQRFYNEAQSFYEKALNIRKKALGEEAPETAQTLNNLANLLKKRGLYDEARPLFQRVLAAFESTYGEEHPYTASVLTNLADVRRDQGEFEEAQGLYEKALGIREKTLGEEHPETAQALNALAILREIHGDPEEARHLYEKALRIVENTLGTEHPNTKVVRRNLEQFTAKQNVESDP